MKTYRVEATASAEADVEEAYLHIRKDSPQNAARWRQGLYGVADTLARIPEGCSYAPENEFVDFEVRQKFYGRYRILFTIEADCVVILGVRHGARLPMKAPELRRRHER